MIDSVLPAIDTNLFNAFVIFARLFDFVNNIAQICFHGNIMNTRLKIAVKMFVIIGILFEHHGVAGQQVREAISGNSSINVELIFVL